MAVHLFFNGTILVFFFFFFFRFDEAVYKQNPCSNHVICVPFEHGFYCRPYSVAVTLLCFLTLSFSDICKRLVKRQHHASFRANNVTILHIPKWPALKNFYRFSVSFYVFGSPEPKAYRYYWGI